MPIAPRPAIATRVFVPEPFLIAARSVAFESIIKTVAVGLDQARRRSREMDRQDQRVGVGDRGEEFSPRDRRLLRVPIRPRRPVGLEALDLVMHEVAGDDRALALREDIDAAMAGRMPRR